MSQSPPSTVIEALVASLEAASAQNPGDAERPVAILWTDRDSQWLPVLPRLRRLMPQLVTLGEYAPEIRTGPSIWLRCVVERAVESPEIPDEMTPVLYLSGVGRQELGAAQTCPGHLKPLVELQYRGTCWTQRNGRDWTVEAFLVSKDGGLGLDVARDSDTRHSMMRALAELATASVQALEGRRLEAEDFDRLFSDDPVRDVLVWLGDGGDVPANWDSARWGAFASRCKADYGFDPENDGELVAAERLGRREGSWDSVWRRYAEAPALYPSVRDLLRMATPHDLFAGSFPSWPRTNEKGEADLQRALLGLESESPLSARERIIELEQTHGERRNSVWAKLGEAPLANSLRHLAVLAERTSSLLGGSSPAEMATLYEDGAWAIDAAALSAIAALRSSADTRAVSQALDAIYQPWLDAAARHLQELVDQQPLPDHQGLESDAARVDSGTVVLFADGLRFDVAQWLLERLRSQGGRLVDLSTRWAALPTVTATAKPAVSPVAGNIEGSTLGEGFLPGLADDGRQLTPDRFRKLFDAIGFQFLRTDETGDPAGRAWTEDGQLDKLGHSLQAKLAGRVDEQIDLLVERIEALFETGWREVRVVTDHGWLWLPGGLPKVDLPKYLTQSRWARCAAIQGGSTVEVPTVPWYWNASERVAIGPGIACFWAGNAYAHGGLSLQESLIPVLRVTAGAGADHATTSVGFAPVSWIGLRCRVRVDTPSPGLSVDLRTRVNDPDSTVSGARPVDADGVASLLVADDDLEGTPAAVVVLEPDGHVIARQSTMIGGEG
ncbi:MAG: BREX-1 system phosphatase PglZ type B [Immundisolibacterales bacterium]|nr:BREX-1 system phosphatase PglZ type B [Immundisolibacterales bacterium]